MAKDLTQVRPPDNEEKWEDQLQWVAWKPRKPKKIRLVGGVVLISQQWIETMSGKRFPMLDPKWNPDSESHDLPNYSPMFDDFGIWGRKLMVQLCIDRDLQERGDPEPVRAVMWPGAVMTNLNLIMDMIKCSPAHPDNGVDLMVVWDPDAKVRTQVWTIQRDDRTKLTDEELEYEYPDLDNIVPDFMGTKPPFKKGETEKSETWIERWDERKRKAKDRAEKQARLMKQAMARHNHYVVPIKDVDPNPAKNPWPAFKGDINGKPWTSFQVLVDYEERQRSGGKKDSEDSDDDRKNRKSRDDDDRSRSRNRDRDDNKSRKTRDDDEDDRTTKSRRRDDDETDQTTSRSKDQDDLPEDLKKSDKSEKSDDEPKRETKKLQTVQEDSNGERPSCYSKYDGTAKCHRCPHKQTCIVDTSNTDL